MSNAIARARLLCRATKDLFVGNVVLVTRAEMLRAEWPVFLPGNLSAVFIPGIGGREQFWTATSLASRHDRRVREA